MRTVWLENDTAEHAIMREVESAERSERRQEVKTMLRMFRKHFPQIRVVA